MGNFSRDTYDKLKHYVGVRLQQGVPLIDADWNEQEDIIRQELRSFLESFVGNGVPKGNDGFHILPPAGSDNDLLITGGTAEDPGRCFAGGWEVLIEDDINYTAQPLYDNDDDLASLWGVDPLAPLSPPDTDSREDLVYLDAWEREVDSQEDDSLVNPSIGLETCVRVKREWVVRVAEGAGVLPDPSQGHVFYLLASITRTAGQTAIGAGDITEKRTLGLGVLTGNLTIKDGNVGIGTTDPDSPLHVQSDGVDSLKVLQNGNVAVGQDTASEKLEVNGRIKDETGYVMPAGGIIMWSGLVDNIPQGWALCDGTNDTPDLRDKFIVGAGQNYNPGTAGGADSVTLTSAQIPSHNHSGSTTSTNGNHRHVSEGITNYGVPISVSTYRTCPGNSACRLFYDEFNNPDTNRLYSRDLLDTNETGNHSHTLTIRNAGSGNSHENRPPYFALCYIMKK